MQILDRPTARNLPNRSGPIRAILIHTTGSSDLDKILQFYTDENGLGPHYLIDFAGQVYQFAQENKIAYHAAIQPNEATAYSKGFAYWSTKKWDTEHADVVDQDPAQAYAEWAASWRPDLESPLDLVTGGHPNARSVGIELQQPEDSQLTPDIFSDAQYATLGELVSDVAKRNQIWIARKFILGHYDVSPLRRSTSKGSWDPGEKFSWDRLFALTRP